MKSPSHGLPSILRLLVPILAALAALVGVVLAPPAQAARAPSGLALHTPAWWSVYDDPWLHELLARSSARPGLVLRGYVELRVAVLRASIAERMHELSVDRLHRLERQLAKGETGASLDPARQQAHRCTLLRRAAAADAGYRLVLLAAVTGEDAESLRPRFDVDVPLPQVSAPLPTAEPRSVRQDDPSSLEREWARQALLDAAERAQRSLALLQAAQLQREAVRLRQGAQAAGEDAAAEPELAWLAQAAQAAGDSGALALAWSQWLQAGGAAFLQPTARAPSSPS